MDMTDPSEFSVGEEGNLEFTFGRYKDVKPQVPRTTYQLGNSLLCKSAHTRIKDTINYTYNTFRSTSRKTSKETKDQINLHIMQAIP